MGKLRDKPLKAKSTTATFFLSPQELLEHEVRLLERMGRVRWPTSLSDWGRRFLGAAQRAKTQSVLNLHVSFRAKDPRAKEGEALHCVELGALISLSEAPIATYFLALGQDSGNGSRRGLRKFHFDLDPIFQAEEPKPTLHLQYPGRNCPALREAGYNDTAFDELDPKLDKPRIPSLPTCFALLAHWALLEYHVTDERIESFISSRDWLSVVTAAECEVLTPFLAYLSTWRGETKNEGKSLLSYFYGFPRPQA